MISRPLTFLPDLEKIPEIAQPEGMRTSPSLWRIFWLIIWLASFISVNGKQKRRSPISASLSDFGQTRRKSVNVVVQCELNYRPFLFGCQEEFFFFFIFQKPKPGFEPKKLSWNRCFVLVCRCFKPAPIFLKKSIDKFQACGYTVGCKQQGRCGGCFPSTAFFVGMNHILGFS